MTIAQLEQRVLTLERAVAALQNQSTPPSIPSSAAKATAEEDIIPGAEYPLVVAVPPKEEFRLRGRIVSVEEGRAELGLSRDEWDSLLLEDDDA
jgi:hypothetical protein